MYTECIITTTGEGAWVRYYNIALVYSYNYQTGVYVVFQKSSNSNSIYNKVYLSNMYASAICLFIPQRRCEANIYNRTIHTFWP